MKRATLILGIIFLILTFIGAAYVIINHGQVNAGYAVIPGLWCMICFSFYRSKKQNNLKLKGNGYPLPFYVYNYTIKSAEIQDWYSLSGSDMISLQFTRPPAKEQIRACTNICSWLDGQSNFVRLGGCHFMSKGSCEAAQSAQRDFANGAK